MMVKPKIQALHVSTTWLWQGVRRAGLPDSKETLVQAFHGRFDPWKLCCRQRIKEAAEKQRFQRGKRSLFGNFSGR